MITLVPSRENVCFIIDALKADPTSGTIAQVTAGVLQLYYRPADVAIHFWDATPDGRRVTATEIHTHRYAFLSTVLYGQFTNIRFTVVPDPEGDFQVSIADVDNTKGTGTLTETVERCRIGSRVEELLSRGQTYYMRADEYHETCVQKDSITWAKQVKPADPSPVYLLVPHEGITGDFQHGTISPSEMADTPLWGIVDRFMEKEW